MVTFTIKKGICKMTNISTKEALRMVIRVDRVA